MYRTKDHIDTEQELKAMVELIEKTWEAPKDCNIGQVIKTMWSESLKACSGYTKVSDVYELVSDMSMSRSDYELWKKAGTTLTKNEVLGGYRDDAITQVYKEIMFNLNKVTDELNDKWDYTKAVKNIKKQILTTYPEVKNIKPKGYKASKEPEDCSDNDDIDYNGVNSGGASCGGFHIRTSLRSCVYDKDGETNYKFLDSLIEATVGHALYVAGHNNGVALKKELEIMKEHFDQPQYFKEIVAQIDVKPFCQSVVLKKLYDTELSKIEFLTTEELAISLKEKKEAKEKFDALPLEERNKRKAEGIGSILEVLRSALNDSNNNKPKM
jgi:hypothetical protein